jgi:HlyD family secretion protein
MVTLAASLPAQSQFAGAVRRYRSVGLSVIALFGISLALFGVGVPISAAVVATGRIEVDGSVKRIQHETGGTVAQILVKEGDHVTAGQVLLRLSPTSVQATVDTLSDKLDQLWMKAARLRAERDGAAAIELPAYFDGRKSEASIVELLAAEERLLAAGEVARVGQKDQLATRIGQYESQIAGLKQQLAATTRLLALSRADVESARKLQAKGVASQSSANALERQYVQFEGQQGQLSASIADAEGRISETRLQISSIDQNAIVEVGRDLEDVSSAIAELTQRRLVAMEQLRGLEIKAPATGVVYQLAVHTVGGVVGAGEVIANIVPADSGLSVLARISPTDIDAVTVGQRADIRFPGLNRNKTPDIHGTVRLVGPALTEDPKGQYAYYQVELAIGADGVEQLNGAELVPGMPTEVFISGSSQTFFQYLIQPIADRMSMAFRERQGTARNRNCSRSDYTLSPQTRRVGRTCSSGKTAERHFAFARQWTNESAPG